MKNAMLGALGAICLLAIAGPWWQAEDEVFAQSKRHDYATALGLLALRSPGGNGKELLTVIDPSTRVVAVYHIDGHSGEIALRSVRNLTWDLQMLEFNGLNPLPQEIRSLLEQ